MQYFPPVGCGTDREQVTFDSLTVTQVGGFEADPPYKTICRVARGSLRGQLVNPTYKTVEMSYPTINGGPPYHPTKSRCPSSP